jgi:hypothetical protein
MNNYFKINTDIYREYIDSDISKRLNEMYSPLICLRHWDDYFIGGLLKKARIRHKSLREDKSLSLEANIVNIISRLYKEKANYPLLKDIAEVLSDKSTKSYSSRFIGSIVRDNLGLTTDHSRDGNIVIVEKDKLDNLMQEYNLK